MFESLANNLCLADVGARCISKRVVANKYIDSGLVEFFASQKLIKFGARGGDSLSRLVRYLGSA